MPRKPVKAVNNNANYNVVVQVPGWFKNELIAHCESLETSLNSWIVYTLREGLRAGAGLPPAPPALAPLPTIEDTLRAYVSGERIVMPCGKPGPCAGDNPVPLGGFEYCPECSIRVR